MITSFAALSIWPGTAGRPAAPRPVHLVTPADRAQSSASQIRWYDAYEQGVREVQARNWQAAEAALLTARERGGPQGPRVLFTGDTYKPFIPDYYLGVVYLNTGRPREAEVAFNAVRTRRLIDQKDRLYDTFDRNARQATFERATADAQTMVAARDFNGARKALADAGATRVNDPAVKKLLDAVEAAERTPVTVTPPVDPNPTPSKDPFGYQPGKGVDPKGTPPPDDSGRGSPGRASDPPANDPGDPYDLGGTGRGDSKTPDKGGNVPPPGDTTPPGGQDAITEQRWSDGVRAFLMGDYQGAVSALEAASTSPTASPRVKLYLACANAALVLTGQADASLLVLAREQFRSADPQRNLLSEDRRYISPRLLDRLRQP